MNHLTEFRHACTWTRDNLTRLWLASLLLVKAVWRLLRYVLTVLVYLAMSLAGAMGVALLGLVVLVHRASGVTVKARGEFGVHVNVHGAPEVAAGGAPSPSAVSAPMSAPPPPPPLNILSWRSRIYPHRREGGLLG